MINLPFGEARRQEEALPSGSTGPEPRCELLAKSCQPMHLPTACTAVI